MMHFAYGSNMSSRLMRRHATGAEPAGVAKLPGYRFVITCDGYASVEPSVGEAVYGLLWRLTARDRVTLDIWENVAAGLYRPELLRCRRNADAASRWCMSPGLRVRAKPSRGTWRW